MFLGRLGEVRTRGKSRAESDRGVGRRRELRWGESAPGQGVER